MKKIYSLLLMLFAALIVNAQIQDPVKVKTELVKLSDTEAVVVLKPTIDKGWHLSSTDLCSVGSVSASFLIDEISRAAF